MQYFHQHIRELPIQINLPEGRIEGEIDLPHGTIRLVDLASKVLGLSSTVADMGARIAANLGRRVSCSKGCGSCCRQLVPLSAPEAIYLAELVASLPKDIGKRIQQQFAEVVVQLKRSELLKSLDRLQQSSSISEEEMQAITKAYFLKRIPCPFLKDESCSIYASRPSRCREYVVTSPPSHCQDPYEKQVDRLPISIRLSEALARMWAEATQTSLQLVPLTLALKWSFEHKSLKGVGANARQMLDVFLFHVTQIAAENEHQIMSTLKGNVSSL
jgi:Fe-S-cluster containining protein